MTQNLEPRIAAHLDFLVDEIGPRPGGSEEDHRAAGYIAQVMAGLGWQVEEQRFDCPCWTHHATRLAVDNQKLAASANAYSPPVDVHATAVGVATLAELKMADIEDRLAVLYGALVRAPLSPKSWFLISDEERELIDLLEDKRPAAVLTVQGHRGGLVSLIEDWEFRIPSATITPAAALALLEHGGHEAHLRIETAQEAGYSTNVVGRSQPKQHTVTLMAHYDTKFDTPGAMDNASGVAALLALAQQLDPATYPFALELVSFSNEEYLPIGDDEYLRRREQKLDDIILAINMDSIGQRLAANSITTFGAADPFRAALSDVVSGYPGLIWTDPWPQSNHSTFAMRGVPAIAFTSTDWGLAHQPDDDNRWLDPRSIASVVAVIQQILKLVAQYPPDWTRSGP